VFWLIKIYNGSDQENCFPRASASYIEVSRQSPVEEVCSPGGDNAMEMNYVAIAGVRILGRNILGDSRKNANQRTLDFVSSGHCELID